MPYLHCYDRQRGNNRPILGKQQLNFTIMEAIETITYRGEAIEVFYDEDATSPKDWDNDFAFIVYDHRSFNVDVKGFDPREIFEHTEEAKRLFFDGYYVFTLYAHIHSGVSLSLSGGRDRWDTSSTGYVLVKKEKGTYHRNKAFKVALSVVEEWNQYLSGDVYGYMSSCGGSCWGFYGSEGRKKMIEEAKAEIDYTIKKKQKKFFDRKKIELKNRIPLIKRTVFTLV